MSGMTCSCLLRRRGVTAFQGCVAKVTSRDPSRRDRASCQVNHHVRSLLLAPLDRVSIVSPTFLHFAVGEFWQSRSCSTISSHIISLFCYEVGALDLSRFSRWRLDPPWLMSAENTCWLITGISHDFVSYVTSHSPLYSVIKDDEYIITTGMWCKKRFRKRKHRSVYFYCEKAWRGLALMDRQQMMVLS